MADITEQFLRSNMGNNPVATPPSSPLPTPSATPTSTINRPVKTPSTVVATPSTTPSPTQSQTQGQTTPTTNQNMKQVAPGVFQLDLGGGNTKLVDSTGANINPSAIYAPDTKDANGNVIQSGEMIGTKDAIGNINYGSNAPSSTLDSAYSTLTTPKPLGEYLTSAYDQLLPMYSDTIRSITQKYAGDIEAARQQGQQDLGQTRAQSAAAGLMGSPDAATAERNTQGKIDSTISNLRAAQEAAINDVLTGIRTNAASLAQSQASQDMQSAQNAIQLRDKARQDALDSVSRLASIPNFDLEKFKGTPEYKNLLDHSGLSENDLQGAFMKAVPPANVIQTWFDGSTMNQLVQDPNTKAAKIMKVDLGITPPKDWTMQKIGTNAIMFTSPGWNPSDPSTYKVFAVDPLTGLPTGDGAGNGFTANLDNANAQNVINATTTAMGVPNSELASPVSDVVSKYGLPNVILGLINQERGSPKGVQNNPGNMKTETAKSLGLTGYTDSGVQATDGGTFASFKSPEDGQKAVAAWVTAHGDLPLSDAIAKYKGVYQQPDAVLGTDKTGGSITSVTGISVPVFNYLTQGTASMSRMSAAQRNQIMKQAQDFLDKNGIDISTFQSRYKAYNEVLQSNIQRQQKTAIMENELTGTIANLKPLADQAGLSNTNLVNISKILLGQQVNDPTANQYAFHFQQLVNELAGYFAASQGKNSPDVIDNQDAAKAIASGLSSQGLDGIDTAVKNSTVKMHDVMQNSVDNANQDVWNLFGVGSKYPSQKNIVEDAFNKAGIKYNDAINKVPAGQIMVVDRKSGQVGTIPLEEFDPATYIRA